MESCRTLLIYFGPEEQSQVIPVFHYALRPGGYLFLGISENVGQFSDLFERSTRSTASSAGREDGGAITCRLPLLDHRTGAGPLAGVTHSSGDAGRSGLRHAVEARVLEQFAPPHVVVNRDGDVIHYSARTGVHLEARGRGPEPAARRDGAPRAAP